MAVGEAGGGDPARGFQWTLTLLPGFPIVLLVLRLWHLSGQDLNTMLLLVHNVHVLELASSLVIEFLEVPPALLLTGHTLGLLYLASVREPRRSWLVRTVERTPSWAVAVSVMWSALVWQLRFLPLLLMLACAIAGLTVRRRGPARLVLPVCVLVPVTVAVLELAWFGPAIVEAFAGGEVVLGLLMALPPPATPLLTGPIPAPVAWLTTHGLAMAGVLLAPFVLLVLFLRAPVLPSVALELREPRPGVVLGSVVAVDDTMTTMLDVRGTVRFVRNDSIQSKALCQGTERIPYSAARARGWYVERSVLDWLLPTKPAQGTRDPRCEGRLP